MQKIIKSRINTLIVIPVLKLNFKNLSLVILGYKAFLGIFLGTDYLFKNIKQPHCQI